MTHLSDSAVQRSAEAEIVERLGLVLSVQLRPGGRVPVGGGANVEVDALSADGRVFVEAYARQGALKGAQLKKIGQDILKLALLKRMGEHAEARTIIAFASDEAHGSIRGWVARAAQEFGVELITVEVSPELRARVLEAQKRQVMINLPADEVAALEDDSAFPPTTSP